MLGRVSDVHPTAVIAPSVRTGSDVTVGPYAVVLGPCELGDGAWIGAHAVIGSPPGDVGAAHGSWQAAQGRGVVIGEGAIVREHAQVESGRDGPTVVGPHAFVMPHAHLSHDCDLGAHVVVGSGAVLGGTVRVMEHVFIGLNSSVHQRCVIGAHAVVGLQSAVVDDIPPFARAAGSPARIRGANRVGMQRRGLGEFADAAEAILLGAADPSATPALADRYAEFAALRRDTDRKVAGVAR